MGNDHPYPFDGYAWTFKQNLPSMVNGAASLKFCDTVGDPEIADDLICWQ